MNHSTPGLRVHHQLPEFTQTHFHWVSDAIQSSHPLSSPSPPALNLSSSLLGTYRPGEFIFQCRIFLPFHNCSWGSQGKITEVVCHSLLQWTTFCQTSPPWPSRLGWPHRAWLTFIELDKAVANVIRLTSFLWLWFQCVCPLMPSCNTYHLTWISLALDEGYLLTAAPDLECRVAPVGPPAPAQPLLLGRGVAPLGRRPWPRTWGTSSAS